MLQYYFLWWQGLNSRLCACHTSTLPLEIQMTYLYTNQIFVCLCVHQHMWGDIHSGEEDVGCTILQCSTLFTWDSGLCLLTSLAANSVTAYHNAEVTGTCVLMPHFYTWVLRICTQVLMSMHSAISPNWAIYSALYLKAVWLSKNSWPLYASFIVSACEME